MNKKRSKQPNDIVTMDQHPTINKTFCDILDIVTAMANDEDDDPSNKLYTIDLSEAKEFYSADQAKNVLSRFRKEGVKKIITCPYNVLPIGDKSGAVYIQAFIWEDEVKMDKLQVMLGDVYKTMLNEHKGMVYYNPAETIRMKSKYARSMYLILLKHVNRKRMTFKPEGQLHGKQFTFYHSIEQFRKQAGIPDSYKLSNIKKTCNIITDEISEITGFTAEVYFNFARQPGTKPVITHIAWTLDKKTEPIEEAEWSYPKTPEEEAGQEELLYQILIMNEVKEITGQDDKFSLDIAMYAKSHRIDREIVNRSCEYAMKQKNIKNLSGYIKHLMDKGGPLPDVAVNPDPEPPKRSRQKYDPQKSRFNDYDTKRNYTADEYDAVMQTMKRKNRKE